MNNLECGNGKDVCSRKMWGSFLGLLSAEQKIILNQPFVWFTREIKLPIN